MMYTIQEIQESLSQCDDVNSKCSVLTDFWRNCSSKPDPNIYHRYSEGAVIDEDKSVKWNREEVKRLNDEYQSECERLRKEYNKIQSLVTDAIIKDLSEEYELSAAECEIIWNRAYSEEHGCGIYSVVDKFRDIAEIYDDLLSVRGN